MPIIPEAAVQAVAEKLMNDYESEYTLAPNATWRDWEEQARTAILAALPYLLADLRERFVVAQDRLTEMARTNGPDRSMEAVRSAHLESKRGGLQLATSYLDELTR